MTSLPEIPVIPSVPALLVGLALAHATPAWAQGDTPEEPPPHPAFKFLPQAEDWSGFDPPEGSSDPFDRFKHIDLTDDGSLWISFGGRVDARTENWTNFNFGAPPGANTDDTFTVSRALLHADLHMDQWFRLYVEGKTAQSTDRDLPGGRRPLDMDTLALQQAFVDVTVPIGDGTIRVRPGRQMLLYGTQRIVSPLPWGNTLRTWDGVTAEWRTGSWSVSGLATAYVPVDKTGRNEADWDNTLYGLYARHAPKGSSTGLELYALGNERANVTVNGTTGDEQRWTLGSRLWTNVSQNVDLEFEGAWQTGEVGQGDVDAWFLTGVVGWNLPEVALKPRLFAGFDLASGDRSPGGDVGTFHQLFPLGHAYLGYVDVIGRQNIAAAHVGTRLTVAPRTTVEATLHGFQVLETGDALYNAGGAPYRSGFTSDDVGTEFDLLAKHRHDRHLDVYLGYSTFWAGRAIEQTGPAEDIHFLYVGLSYVF